MAHSTALSTPRSIHRHALRAALPAVLLLVLLWPPPPAAGQGGPAATLFVTADRCMGCHNGLVTPTGEDVSMGSDWRPSMMANSARDPYWQASVRRETIAHPEVAAAIQDECSACHMPMMRFEAKTAGGLGPGVRQSAGRPGRGAPGGSARRRRGLVRPVPPDPGRRPGRAVELRRRFLDRHRPAAGLGAAPAA